MNPEERLKNWKLHDSIRGWFGRALYEEMSKDDRIYLLTADLGYGLFDAHRDDFPDRFINVGASECAALGVGIGLALSGKVPFVYSITTFLLFRPAEWIRNYLNHEQVPVRLIGSGINDDYKHDGFSHQPDEMNDIDKYFDMFPDIETYFPNNKEGIPWLVSRMINENAPSFMCLRR